MTRPGVISFMFSQISPIFKKNFAQLQKFGYVACMEVWLYADGVHDLHRESLHVFEIFPVPYPVTPWVAPKPEHRPTNFRIDDSEYCIVRPSYLISSSLPTLLFPLLPSSCSPYSLLLSPLPSSCSPLSSSCLPSIRHVPTSPS